MLAAKDLTAKYCTYFSLDERFSPQSALFKS